MKIWKIEKNATEAAGGDSIPQKSKQTFAEMQGFFYAHFFPQSTIKTTGKGAMFSIFKPKKPKLVIVEVKITFSNAYLMLREEYVLPEHKQVDKTKFLKEEI